MPKPPPGRCASRRPPLQLARVECIPACGSSRRWAEARWTSCSWSNRARDGIAAEMLRQGRGAGEARGVCPVGEGRVKLDSRHCEAAPATWRVVSRRPQEFSRSPGVIVGFELWPALPSIAWRTDGLAAVGTKGIPSLNWLAYRSSIRLARPSGTAPATARRRRGTNAPGRPPSRTPRRCFGILLLVRSSRRSSLKPVRVGERGFGYALDMASRA